MYVRNAGAQLLTALGDTPAVMIAGPRQAGKTTLARWAVEQGHPAEYLTLDDPRSLAAAHDDPISFVGQVRDAVVIDEVQRAPELLSVIKMAIDADRRPGRFLLTGSADFLTLPKVSESLAGRVEVVRLWPLTVGEERGMVEGFVDRVFSPERLMIRHFEGDRSAYLDVAMRGRFPEIVAASAARQDRWFASYVETMIQRDLREVVALERVVELPRLLRLLAARHSALLNYADLGRDAGIPQTTLKRYLGALLATYVVQTVPAWHSNLAKRSIKAPKVFMVDNGLVTSLLNVDRRRLELDPELAGPMLEGLVFHELRAQVAWSGRKPTISHFRTQAGDEVDLVLEDRAGPIVGIEVKASPTVGQSDFRGLRHLAEAAGGRFVRGIVLYTGDQSLPFGEAMQALPISALWTLGVGEQETE